MDGPSSQGLRVKGFVYMDNIKDLISNRNMYAPRSQISKVRAKDHLYLPAKSRLEGLGTRKHIRRLRRKVCVKASSMVFVYIVFCPRACEKLKESINLNLIRISFPYLGPSLPCGGLVGRVQEMTLVNGDRLFIGSMGLDL